MFKVSFDVELNQWESPGKNSERKTKVGYILFFV